MCAHQVCCHPGPWFTPLPGGLADRAHLHHPPGPQDSWCHFPRGCGACAFLSRLPDSGFLSGPLLQAHNLPTSTFLGSLRCVPGGPQRPHPAPRLLKPPRVLLALLPVLQASNTGSDIFATCLKLPREVVKQPWARLTQAMHLLCARPQDEQQPCEAGG